MPCVPYGATGKLVSRLGFGGMRFGKDLDASVKALVRAQDLGINYFDTAPGYCDGRSEKIFGEAFKSFDRRRPFHVSTKSSSTEDPDARRVMNRIDASLECMGIPRITFFNMWSIMSSAQFAEIRRKDGPLEGAVRARELGLVEHIAFSTHAPPAATIEIMRSGLFEGVTISFNMANVSAMLPVVREASALGLAVITMNPLGGGSLLNPAYHHGTRLDLRGLTLAQALLRFNASFPEVTVVLSGMASAGEVEENVEALSAARGETLPESTAAALEGSIALDSPFCTDCGYCLPCPEGIDIPVWIRAGDLAAIGQRDLALEILDAARGRKGKDWRMPDACTRCMECEARCTQRLEIVRRLDEI